MRIVMGLFLLGFMAVSSLYYITLEHNKLNKGFHDRYELRLVDDKGMVIDGE